MTDEAELTVRLALLAIVLTLLIAFPKGASGSPIRDILAAVIGLAGFFSFCALIAETLVDVKLFALPVSGIVSIALLWWVVEPKITPRLRPLLPDRQTGQFLLTWAVRVVGIFFALFAYWLGLTTLPVAILGVFILASGLVFLRGLLSTLRQQIGPSATRRERLRGWGGFALVTLGMAMIYTGSFGILFLFNFPNETGTRRVVMSVLFGPVYYLGWPICFLGLWLVRALRTRG